MLRSNGPLASYLPIGGAHDEMVDIAGGLREHWVPISSAYERMGSAELSRRHGEIQQLLEQDGVTYNVADHTAPPTRMWKVDPIPFLLRGDEWNLIERGLVQRAEILDMVLADLYGDRRLLRDGVIPSAMILSDPQFLRACDGLRLPGGKQVVMAATDFGRDVQGAWRVFSHRAQAPSGAAYSLENRRVLSRVFPQLLRETGVRRLAHFIEDLRSALLAAAPPGVDDPSIVILSPGSLSETAFEHASIAAQLGYPLVQGSDFEVRDGRIGLRTVGDWEPVHVILRRVDAGFCDPLALRSDSTLGIPGLVDACRAGTVSVVNPLGSGILENAGLGGLMSTLARRLLDSDLVLESVPSWWCGDPVGRSHVLDNLGSFIVRPLSRLTLENSIDTTQSSPAELDELRRRILASPDDWVGQERLVAGSTPVLTERGVEARTTVLRSFVVASGSSFVALPGGLARSATVAGRPITSQAGATSKDVWVLGRDVGARSEVAPTLASRPVVKQVAVLPARAAEHLFWLGRYAERSEATVRLIRTIVTRRDEFLDADTGPGPAALTAMLEALTRITGTYPGFVGDDSESLLENPVDELLALIVDRDRPGTIAHAVQHMFDALDVVRDQLSLDTWLVVGSLQQEIDRLGRIGRHDRHHHGVNRRGATRRLRSGGETEQAMGAVLNDLLQGLLAMSGLADESMVRDLGWQFMEAGRRIERAIHVSMLVGATLATERSAPVEGIVIESVLITGESIITSRRRYRSHVGVASTVDLLVGDPGNPRSVRFQLDRLSTCLAVLDARSDPAAPSHAQGLLSELRAMLGGIDATEVARPDETGSRRVLDELVATVRTTLMAISDEIGAEKFRRMQSQFQSIRPMWATSSPQATA